MGATRFPNKVLKPICGRPMIELLLERLARARELQQIVLATTTDARNAPLVAHVRALGYHVFQGSENDVLDRYYRAAVEVGADVVVRVTGDCPLIDPGLLDRVVRRFAEG